MKFNSSYLLILLSLSISCTQNQQQNSKTQSPEIARVPATAPETGAPIIAIDSLLTDFPTFWNYYVKHVQLYEKFKASDPVDKTISRQTFLEMLMTGKYFPLSLHTADSSLHYKLQSLPASADPYIAQYMVQFSRDQLVYLKMEGKKIPAFSFTDLNGKLYTPENTKGKILLFKCWFINCVPCIKEMPALNQIVDDYKDRDDILFISLATDARGDLVEFLKKTKFDYATIPGQKEYISTKLNTRSYPTHFLIDKEGILVQVLPDDVQVAKAIARLAGPPFSKLTSARTR